MVDIHSVLEVNSGMSLRLGIRPVRDFRGGVDLRVEVTPVDWRQVGGVGRALRPRIRGRSPTPGGMMVRAQVFARAYFLVRPMRPPMGRG